MNRALAIINPAAGGGKCGRRAPGVLGALADAGVAVDIVETERPGHATEIVKQAWREGRRRFIGCGGDGTSYEIVNGLFPMALGAADKPVLGFLPLGTGNSFLRDFSHDGARYAIECIRDGRTRTVDVIRADHADGAIHYLNLLSIGFTADVGGFVNRNLKPLGEAGYGVGVVWELARLAARPLPFALDGGPLDRRPIVFVSFSNSKFTGGKMMMAPNADPSDGRLDAVVVGAMGRAELIRTFPRIFRGTHVEHDAIAAHRAARVDLALDGPLEVMVDGEVVSLQLTALEVCPAALEVMA